VPRLIWSSSLDRGVENLLYLYPFIKNRYPDTTLDIYYGWGQWFNEGNRKQFKDDVMATINRLPDVKFYGRVSQDILHKAQKEADAWLYPSAFHETLCITAIENMLARNVIVCSKLAGLIDTVGPRGIIIEGNPYSKEYRERFLNEFFGIWEDKERLNQLLDLAEQWAKTQTWENRAKSWQGIFNL